MVIIGVLAKGGGKDIKRTGSNIAINDPRRLVCQPVSLMSRNAPRINLYPPTGKDTRMLAKEDNVHGSPMLPSTLLDVSERLRTTLLV